MPILNDKQLEYNSRIKINFDGGDLSSDTGLLLIKEFINKIGFEKIVKKYFKPMILQHFVFIQMIKTYFKKYIKLLQGIFRMMMLMN